MDQLRDQLHRQEAEATKQAADLIQELDKLQELRRIPNIMERARRLEAEVTLRMDQARNQSEAIITAASNHAAEKGQEAARQLVQARHTAETILGAARLDGEQRKQQIVAAVDKEHQLARAARLDAENLARTAIDEARAEAKKIAAAARKEAREKTQAIDATLNRATLDALGIRRQAETRAREIGGQAYEALRRHSFYEAAALAAQRRAEGYADTYPVPAEHVLDDLAYDFGFHKAGEQLKLARERVKIMLRNQTAATSDYPAGWKWDHAIKFVLGVFNGQVDSILARIQTRPSRQADRAGSRRLQHGQPGRPGLPERPDRGGIP